MSEKRLVVGPPPYLRTAETASRIQQDVLIALAPVVLVGLLLYGSRGILLIVGCVLGAVAADMLGQRLRGVKVSTSDFSAVITGLLLAMMLPPSLPVWMGILAAFMGIAIAKQTFGGLGENVFNPALVGRGILMLSYPAYMIAWLEPFSLEPGQMPLMAGEAAYGDLLLGGAPGWLGGSAALAAIVGGTYLIVRKRTPWHTPAAFLAAMGVVVLALGHDPIFHLLAAGTPLIAFFVITDPVTSPLTARGRLAYGAGVGLLAGLMRVLSDYPEGTIFAILLMNAVVPLIDTYIKPRMRSEVAA